MLPLVNATNDPALDTSDGITESLINSLSKIPRLKVMSRNSVFRLKAAASAPTFLRSKGAARPRAAARKALSLDDGLAEGHVALAQPYVLFTPYDLGLV